MELKEVLTRICSSMKLMSFST